jgi:cation transport regulator
MPYATVADLPRALQSMPVHAQEIFRAAFNAAWDVYDNRGPRKREQVADHVAWAAVKRWYRPGRAVQRRAGIAKASLAPGLEITAPLIEADQRRPAARAPGSNFRNRDKRRLA